MNEPPINIADVMKQCDELARRRHELIQRRLDRLAEFLRSARDPKQVERMQQECLQTNNEHNVQTEWGPPRWLPRRVFGFLAARLRPFVLHTLEVTEARQSHFNSHATRTLNELVDKMLSDERALLDYVSQLNRLLIDIYSSLEARLGDPNNTVEVQEETAKDLRELMPRLQAELEAFDELLENHSAETADADTPADPSAESQ